MATTLHPQKRSNWHDAFDTQMALWRWYRTPEGLRYLRWHLNDAIGGLHPDTGRMLTGLYQSELSRLLHTDPIYVSAEMCEVIDAAKDSFEPEPLLETDLLTPGGFVFFEKPFLIPDRFEQPVSIHAFSWAPVASVKSADIEPGTLEEQEQEAVEAGFTHDVGDMIRGIAITLYSTTRMHISGQAVAAPVVIPMHVTPWWFHMTFDGNEVDENGVPTGAAWWWRIVQVTLRLMQQRIAVKHIHRPDRANRREAKALGMPIEPEIVVVRLRREASETSEPSGEEANYSHRFIVSGHWRNQPYPKEGIYRQIWISPYVKGPTDAPLIVRPRRVYQWDR